jgi:hypothetical protein
VKREQLTPYLDVEVEKWSAKSFGALRAELKPGPYNEAEIDADHHLEFQLLEDKEDYIHVLVTVGSETVGWSCFHP